MGGWTGFYILTSDAAAIGAVRKLFPLAISGQPVKIEQEKDFVRVNIGPYASEVPSTDLERLSSNFSTDVIWVRFHSGTETFEFHHWRAGKALRALVFGLYEERTWERVEGSAEPWERKAFFDPRNLQSALEQARDNAEKQELERIWREAELVPGRTEPSFSSSDCVDEMCRHYQIR
jgi:hypothetical protein